MRFIIIYLLFCSTGCYSQAVSIRADEWFPMNGKPGADLPGFMIEIAQHAFGQVDYKLMPWRRAINEVRSGSIDCVVGASSLAAPDLIFPEESWGEVEFGIYVRATDDWSYKGRESFMRRKVGVVVGYLYDDFDDFINKHKKVFKPASGTDALEKNIKQLLAHRLDTVIESTLVANSKTAEMGVAGHIKKVGSIGPVSPIYIACSPAKPGSYDLVKKVDDTTRVLRANGKLELILNKYGLKDWQPK